MALIGIKKMLWIISLFDTKISPFYSITFKQYLPFFGENRSIYSFIIVLFYKIWYTEHKVSYSLLAFRSFPAKMTPTKILKFDKNLMIFCNFPLKYIDQKFQRFSTFHAKITATATKIFNSFSIFGPQVSL